MHMPTAKPNPIFYPLLFFQHSILVFLLLIFESYKGIEAYSVVSEIHVHSVHTGRGHFHQQHPTHTI